MTKDYKIWALKRYMRDVNLIVCGSIVVLVICSIMIGISYEDLSDIRFWVCIGILATFIIAETIYLILAARLIKKEKKKFGID